MMGCDIHGYWEALTPDGTWVAFRDINDTRSYSWFGIIADVRVRFGSQTANRGVPDNTSSAWQHYCDFMGYNLHSHTWLTLAEIKKANSKYAKHVSDEYHEKSDESHETILAADTLVNHLYTSYSKKTFECNVMQWTGTVSDLVGIRSQKLIAERLRYVCAFDN